eukprot:jgi/Ulvmu1/12658/UM094_0014.1
MDEEDIQECFEAENGFMAKLCEYSVPLDKIPANASLLAASSSTGMIMVANSAEGQHSVLLMKNFAEDMPSGVKHGSPPLADSEHVRIPLPSACFCVSWSPDDCLIFAACVSGDIVVFGAEHLAMGNAQPISHFLFPNPRQVSWAGDSKKVYFVSRSHELKAYSLTDAAAVTLLQEGVTAIATHRSAVAVASNTDLCIYQQTGDGLQLLLKHPISIPVDGAPAFIDGMAFISADTLILEVLAVSTDDQPDPQPEGPLQDLPSEEVFFKLIELDSGDAPTAVCRDALAPERFHNQFEPIPADTAAAAPKCVRLPRTGPFFNAATFPAAFPAAVVASSLLHELHYVHFMRRVDGEDAAAGAQWWAVSNSMDDLQLQLPGARQDGSLVPNYIVGCAAFICRPGVHVIHPTDGIEPAQDVPQVLFLMSGGQLIVCNVGTFAVGQPHAATVRLPVPPAPLSFAPAAAAAVAPDPAPPPSPHGSDLLVFQDGADGATAHVLPQVSQDLEDVESEWNDENADDAENATPSRQLLPAVNQPDVASLLPPAAVIPGAVPAQTPLQPRHLSPSSSSASSHSAPSGSADSDGSVSDASATSPAASTPALPPSLSPDAAAAPGASPARPVLRDAIAPLTSASLQEGPLSNLHLQSPSTNTSPAAAAVQPGSTFPVASPSALFPPPAAPAAPFFGAGPASTSATLPSQPGDPAGSLRQGPIQASSSLFGQSLVSQANGGSIAASSASLFSAPAGAMAAPVFGGAFSAPALAGATSATTGLFGAPAFAAATSATASLFGALAAAPTASSASLFGGMATDTLIPSAAAAAPSSLPAPAFPPAGPAVPSVLPPAAAAPAPLLSGFETPAAAASASADSSPRKHSSGPVTLPTPAALGATTGHGCNTDPRITPAPHLPTFTGSAIRPPSSGGGSNDLNEPAADAASSVSPGARSPHWSLRGRDDGGSDSGAPSAGFADGSFLDSSGLDAEDGSVDEVMSPAPKITALAPQDEGAAKPGLMRKLKQRIETAPPPAAVDVPADAPPSHRKMTQELRGVQAHLAEVAAAAALAEEHGAAQGEQSHVRGRTAELQEMSRWCKAAGREAVVSLARQVRGCQLKLDAVRDMLGDQAAELRGHGGWASEEESPERAADEVPHREEAPPQRIVQVVHGKILASQEAVQERMADLTAACDAMEASQQAVRNRTAPAAPAAAADPFTAVAEIGRAAAQLRTRLLVQRATLLRATATAAEALASSPLVTPRLPGSPAAAAAASSHPWPRPTGGHFRSSLSPSTVPAPPPSVTSDADTPVHVTRAPSAQYTAHAAYVRAMVERSARKHLVQTSDATPEMAKLQRELSDIRKEYRDSERAAKPTSATARRRSAARTTPATLPQTSPARIAPATAPVAPTPTPTPTATAPAAAASRVPASVVPPVLSAGAPARMVTPPLFPKKKPAVAAPAAATLATAAAPPAALASFRTFVGAAAKAPTIAAAAAPSGWDAGTEPATAAGQSAGVGDKRTLAAPAAAAAAAAAKPSGFVGAVEDPRAKAAQAAPDRTWAAATSGASSDSKPVGTAPAAAALPAPISTSSLFSKTPLTVAPPVLGGASLDTKPPAAKPAPPPTAPTEKPATAAAAAAAAAIAAPSFGLNPPSAAAAAPAAASFPSLFSATSAAPTAAPLATPGSANATPATPAPAPAAVPPVAAPASSTVQPPLFPPGPIAAAASSAAASAAATATANLFSSSLLMGASTTAAASGASASAFSNAPLSSPGASLGSITFTESATTAAAAEPAAAAATLFATPASAAAPTTQPAAPVPALPAFGIPATSAPAFAAPPAAASTAASCAPFSSFASTSAFGGAAPADAPRSFGSMFGGAASQPPAVATASASAFPGAAASTTAFSAFGAPATFPPAPAASTPPAFPSAPAASTAPLFNTFPTQQAPLFGSSPASAPSLFGSQPPAAPASQPASAFGQPGFGQPAQLGGGMQGMQGVGGQFGQVTPLGSRLTPPAPAAPTSGFGFGSFAQPQPAFGPSFGAPSTSATAAAPVFGAAFGAPASSAAAAAPVFGATFGGGGAVSTSGGGFAAMAQHSAPAFGGSGGGGGFGGLAGAAASSAAFGSGFAFGGGQTFGGGGQPSPFGGGLGFGGGAGAPQVPPNADPAMFAPRR